MRRSQGGVYILAKLNGSVWQNKVVAFRVIPYLARRKISFVKEVQDLLDASETDLRDLTKESEEAHTLDIGEDR